MKLLAELGCNLFLPWLVFTITEPAHGELYALIASSFPPVAWSVGELFLHRRLDALSTLVLGGIVVSVLAMVLGGDARILLVRESLISGLIGAAFLVSLLTGRPLVFYLARATMLRQNGQEGRERFNAWSQSAIVHHGLRVMTLVWGIGLTFEAGLRIWAALEWPPARFLALMPPAGYAFAAALTLWTFWYARKLRQRAAHTQDRTAYQAPEAQ